MLPWPQYSRCHFVSFVMYIPGARFEDHCSNISGDILNSVFYSFIGTIYDVITFLICIIQKGEYLENEKRYSKKKNATLLYFEKPFKQAAIIFYFIGTVSYQATNNRGVQIGSRERGAIVVLFGKKLKQS